ncbi:MAG: hypothetical protein HY327_12940 [Chloroflexi bacterium]|nr:hypothetical protein [Chloroflexota bacterium]
MPTPNPTIAEELKRAKEELARIKAEKTRLYPPNLHPLAQPDSYPDKSTSAQIQQRNEMVRKIEALEQQIEMLQDQLYRK